MRSFAQTVRIYRLGLSKSTSFGSSRPEVFSEKGVLRNFTKLKLLNVLNTKS